MKSVIIIGAGLGGLFAGNLLVKKGYKVTIFESHSMPGGYTAGFYRKGYYFESGTINLELADYVFDAMKEIGVLKKIDFVKLKTRFFSKEFDGIPENYKDYKKMLYSSYPYEKEKLDSVFSDLDNIIGLMGKMDVTSLLSNSGIKMLISMIPSILSNPKLIKRLKQYGSMTSSEFASRYFEKGSVLYWLFNGFSYPDMPAIAIGGNISATFEDVWTVKGGMQSWADVLAENFKELGGDLKLKSYVDKIITRNSAAVGVSCNNTIYSADYVISAGDYKKTFLKLLDNKNLIPTSLHNNISLSEVSEGFFTVYLGLNISNEELGKYMKDPHVYACDKSPDYDIYNSTDAEFFNKTSLTFYSPSMINPNLAPEGKSSLMLMTMVPYQWMNNWGDGDKEKYKQLKGEALDALINKASSLIPDLEQYIDYKDAATPLTYERFTHNTDGATSAWSWNPKKQFFRNGLGVNVKTPVKNLYIGSCWSMQIGGVPGAIAAAYLCANKII